MFTISYLQKAAIILLVAQSTPVPAAPPVNINLNSTAVNLINPNFAVSGKAHVTKATCGGSFWCPRINNRHNYINNYLQDWMRYSIADDDIYDPGVQIACATVTIWLPPLGTNAYCASTTASIAGEGGSSPAGINGTIIKQKMEELRTGGCFACGKVPWEGRIFKVDYVARGAVRCGRPGEVICPPTVPGTHRQSLKRGPRPVLRTFNVTKSDKGVSLQMLNIGDPTHNPSNDSTS
ncbi:hypothetical protein BDR22DRAFT_821063 [Usnea florida]